jgi:proline iminopeptidase
MSVTPATLPTTPAAFASGMLDVGHGHRIAFEQAGNPDGIPVVMLHGGPGSGAPPRQRALFDASRWRIVQFDQRGTGRSTPLGETAHNHTDALVADIEALREHLRIERWLVVGGSWGASLALAYASRHRARVAGVFLRGTFLTGAADLDWFFHGVVALAPEANDAFLRIVPRRWRRNVPAWLDRCFARDDPRSAAIAATWQRYENALAGDAAIAHDAPLADASPAIVAKFRVQAHYLARRCFLGESTLLRAASTLSGIPLAIVHGRNDLVCRAENAWRVHRACAGSRLAWASNAGHGPFEPATLALTRAALDAFADDGDFSRWRTDTPA